MNIIANLCILSVCNLDRSKIRAIRKLIKAAKIDVWIKGLKF